MGGLSGMSSTYLSGSVSSPSLTSSLICDALTVQGAVREDANARLGPAICCYARSHVNVGMSSPLLPLYAQCSTF